MQLDKAIQTRHSTKKFKSKAPDWRDIIEAIDAARYAPMAGKNFSLKFILVQNPEKIQEIEEACQQPFVGKAKSIVVACTNPARTENLFGNRAEKYLRQQAGAAIQNFLLKLQETGLSTAWVGHFVDSQIKKTLSIPDSIEIEAIFPIGIEFAKPTTVKAKIDLNQILYFDKYKNKQMVEHKTIY